MVIQTRISTRPVEASDKNKLAHLIHFGTYVHSHLDWKPPLDWIGESPFYVAESHKRVVAALACPPAPPQIAWIRMFLCSSRISYRYAWENLWPPTIQSLEERQIPQVAAIPLQKWFRVLLAENGFLHNHNVIVLAWDLEPGKLSAIPPPKDFKIRRMEPEDLPKVHKIDAASFTPLWQNAADSINLAFQQAIYATVIEDDQNILGYQISSPTPYGAHLGRLATSKEHQNKGIGYTLLHDLVSRLSQQKIHRISVNTQENNQISRRLYKKAGFIETNEAYPVYLYLID